MKIVTVLYSVLWLYYAMLLALNDLLCAVKKLLTHSLRLRSHRHECESEYPYIRVPVSMSLHVLETVNSHALSYVLVQVTANAPLVRVKLVRVTDNP